MDAQGNLVRINPYTGKASPVLNEMGQPVKGYIRPGLSVQQTPQGGFTITEGGMQYNPNQATAQPSAPQPQPQGGMPPPPESALATALSNSGLVSSSPRHSNKVASFAHQAHCKQGAAQRVMY